MIDTFLPIRLQEIAQFLGGVISGEDCTFTRVSTDSKLLMNGSLFVAIVGQRFDGHNFVTEARERGACAALVSRNVPDPLPQLRVTDTLLALGRLSGIWRQRFTGPLVAITGSNGKTTLKEMVAKILGVRGLTLANEGNLNNNIGVPLTLLRLQREHAYAVIEMGANHHHEIAYLTGLAKPTVAVINNIGPCHLEGFGDLAGVARGKGEIFQGLGPDGIAVINRDDVYADYWVGLNINRQIMDFSLDKVAFVSGKLIDPMSNFFQIYVDGKSIDIQLNLPGRHNVRNALAATAAAMAVGLTLDEVRCGLESLRDIHGRMQRLRSRYGGTVIHDAYNANPASLAAALDVVGNEPGRKWLVLGDMNELGSDTGELHARSGLEAIAAGLERLYGIGEYSAAAVVAFGKGGRHFKDMDALISALTNDLLECNELSPPMVLVKGSRGMRMERVVAALIAPYNWSKNQEECS
jgi:UDP-N-acetylmuramoyl-tripeptide--D-alanyl-D-alanine ligase